MKTKNKTFLVLGIIVLVFLFVLLCVVVYHHKYNKLIIDPVDSDALFHMSAEDFCESKGKGTSIEGAYTFAKVDKDGYLILIMSDSQLNDWKSSRYDTIALQAVLGEKKILALKFQIQKMIYGWKI